MTLHECRKEEVIENLQDEERDLRGKLDRLSSDVTTLQTHQKHGVEDHARIRDELNKFITERFKPIESYVWGDVKTSTQWGTQFRANFRQIVMALTTAALLALAGLLFQLYNLRSQMDALRQQPPPPVQREVRP